MPTHVFPTELAERDAKAILLDLCRSSASAQNLERIVRCLLQFWDPVKCSLTIDKDIAAEIFESLKYAPESTETIDLSSLSLLDIKIFLHLCIHCAHVRSERIKEKGGKVISLSATEQWTSDRQRSWWRAAWALCHNTGKQEDRVRLQEGIEVIRLKSRDTPELPLLISVAAMLENEVPDAVRYTGGDEKAVGASDYALRYWSAIDQILERDRVTQPRPDAYFYAGLAPLPRSRRDHYRSMAKYYMALNALMHGKEDDCITILEELQSPLAFFALAKIYKTSADNVRSRQGEVDTETRKRAMLLKARDALRSTMNKLEAQAGAGGLSELEVSGVLEDIEESLGGVHNAPLLPTNGESGRRQQRNPGAYGDPQITPSVGYYTPVSRFVPSRSASGNAQSSLLLELGQSVDFVLRSLTQSQDTLVRAIMEQNRALTNTCDGMMAQMKELTLTNRTLVEEMKKIWDVSQAQRLRETFETTSASVSTSPQKSAPISAIPTDQAAKPSVYMGATSAMKPPSTQESLAEKFKPKPGSWACKDCYTRNDESAKKCVCCGCLCPAAAMAPTPAPPAAAPAPTTAMLAPPALAPAPTLATPVPAAITPAQATAAAPTLLFSSTPMFGVFPKPAAAATTQPIQPVFGGQGTTPPARIFGGSGATPALNFAALAAKNEAAPAFQPFQGLSGSSTVTPLFGIPPSGTPQRTRQESETEDGAEAPFEPTLDFKPVIPLPALVETKTGEEDEEVLFRERAKLYRWEPSTKEFKERGVGDLKILKHNETGAVRLLMRREQVWKICANHKITPGMKLSPMQKSDRAFTWICQDYADGELKNETLAVRFKDTSQAQNFKEAFEAAAATGPESQEKTVSKTVTSQKKAQDGGNADDELCVVYQAKATSDGELQSVPISTIPTDQSAKPSVYVGETSAMKPPSTQESLAEKFKPKPGSWACKDCYTRNDESAKKCVCCGCHCPTTAMPPAPAPPTVVPTPALATPVPTASTPAPAATTLAPAAVTPAPTLLFSSTPMFGVFPKPAAAATTQPIQPVFVGQGTTPPARIFGGTTATPALNFAALAAKNETAPAFKPFQGLSGPSSVTPLFGIPPSGTPQRTRQESETEDGAEAPFEPTLDFKPVIPLPALVETKTGEEDEEVLFRERAKLYRWEPSTKEFKERGVGDLKILKHKESGSVRLLMRREQVWKICANHKITPGMKLSPMQKSDRAFTWICQDYADGELKNETLAVRFKDTSQAQKFTNAFEAAAGGASQEKTISKPITSQKKAQDGGNAEDELRVVYEAKATSDGELQARKFMLPKTFYVDRPPCPGCVGCASDEVQENVLRNLGRGDRGEE